MRHIIKGNPTQIERSAMEAALNQHQAKYGDYAPSKESENYTVLVDGMKIVVEIMNRKKSYVATSMMRPRDLSKVWGERSVSEFASNTPLEHKDRWQTPIEVFAALDAEFGFYLDAAADHGNALCARYLTERDDALNSEWESYGAIWCNPPYSAITPWVQKSAEQCKAQSQPVVMLLPADTSTGWFSLALESVDEVRIITGGRLAFINAGTGKPGKNGNSKGSLLFIWRPFIKPRCQFTTVSRDELIAIGSSIMAGVKAA